MKFKWKVFPYFLLAVCLLLSINSHGAVSYETSIADSGTSSNGASLTVPASVQEGDVLVAHVSIGLGGTSNFTEPSGWNLIDAIKQSGGVQQSLYYKVATAGEAGTTYTWGFSGIPLFIFNTARPYVLGMSVFKGVDNNNPIADDSSWTGSVPNNRKIVAPSVTTINVDSYLYSAYAVDSGRQSFTPPNTMTEHYDLAAISSSFFTEYGVTAMSATESFAGIGSSGGREARVANRNSNGIAQLVSLNADVVPPEINEIITSCNDVSTLSIEFSELLDVSTAEDISNYSLVSAGLNSIAITQASLAANIVTLTLANDMSDLTPYTITVNNVEGISGNEIISNTSRSLMLSCGINCVTEDFNTSSLSGTWSVGNSGGTFGDPRIEGNHLRLTDNSANVATLATLLKRFAGADNRIEIEFDYFAYGGGGADGIAVIFSDASVSPASGASGGALGYAQKYTVGFAGGWLGIGIDEFGNFSEPLDGNKVGGPGRQQQSVAIRGSGSGMNGYPYLAGTFQNDLNPGVDDSSSTSPSPGHRYKVVIDHTSGGRAAYASVFRDAGAGYEEIIPEFNVFDSYDVSGNYTAQADVPADWLLSFTGSTGGATNFHEIDNLKVCAAQPIENIVENGVDHSDISHSSPGVTCEGSKVTITAVDVNSDPIVVSSDTSVSITTNPAVDGIINSPVIIPAGDSSFSVYLQQTTELADIDIDVLDENGMTDNEGSLEDPRISFLDTAFRFYADGSNTDTNPIHTQISGKPTNALPLGQSLSLRAIRTNTDTGACEAGLAGSQTVSFAYTCIDPNTCSSAQLLVSADETKSLTGTDSGGGLTYTDLDMIFDASGSAPFQFTFPDAGKIQLYANLDVAESLPDPAFTLTGSSNEFVVRPFAFDLGLTGNYEASDSNGSQFVSAGSSFPMTIRAVNWQASDDSDNDGFVDDGGDVSDNSTTINFGQEITGAQALAITHTLRLPAGGSDGNLTSTEVHTSASAGFFTLGVTDSDPAVNVSWDEVGIIDINANLDDYLSTLGANITGVQANIGRFYPARFALISSSLTNSCSGYSYMGQPGINISYSIEAHNVAGNKTQNYDGSFAKATVSMVAENNNEGTNYQSRLSDFNSTNWNQGSYVYSDDGVFDRLISSTASGTLDGPYKNLQVGIQLDDNDGSVSALTGLNMRAGTISDCGTAGNCNALALEDSLDVRFGQLKLNNVFGPETSPLDMVVQTEYYDGTSFVLNTDDSCTVLFGSAPELTAVTNSYSDNLDAGETAPTLISNITSGLGVIQFSAAGVGNQGSVTYLYDTITYLPWLNTENDDDANDAASYADNPFGKITFGQFRGNDRRLYWREIVR